MVNFLLTTGIIFLMSMQVTCRANEDDEILAEIIPTASTRQQKRNMVDGYSVMSRLKQFEQQQAMMPLPKPDFSNFRRSNAGQSPSSTSSFNAVQSAPSTVGNQDAAMYTVKNDAADIANDVDKYGLYEYTADNTGMADQLHKIIDNGHVGTIKVHHELENKASQINANINKYIENAQEGNRPTIDPLETPADYAPAIPPSPSGAAQHSGGMDVITIPNSMTIEDEHGRALDSVREVSNPTPVMRPAGKEMARLKSEGNSVLSKQTDKTEAFVPKPSITDSSSQKSSMSLHKPTLESNSDTTSLTYKLYKALKTNKKFLKSAQQLLANQHGGGDSLEQLVGQHLNDNADDSKSSKSLADIIKGYNKLTYMDNESKTKAQDSDITESTSSNRSGGKKVEDTTQPEEGEEDGGKDTHLIKMIKKLIGREKPHSKQQESTAIEQLAKGLSKQHHKVTMQTKVLYTPTFTSTNDDTDHPLGDDSGGPLMGFLESETNLVTKVKDDTQDPRVEVEKLESEMVTQSQDSSKADHQKEKNGELLLQIKKLLKFEKSAAATDDSAKSDDSDKVGSEIYNFLKNTKQLKQFLAENTNGKNNSQWIQRFEKFGSQFPKVVKDAGEDNQASQENAAEDIVSSFAKGHEVNKEIDASKAMFNSTEKKEGDREENKGGSKKVEEELKEIEKEKEILKEKEKHLEEMTKAFEEKGRKKEESEVSLTENEKVKPADDSKVKDEKEEVKEKEESKQTETDNAETTSQNLVMSVNSNATDEAMQARQNDELTKSSSDSNKQQAAADVDTTNKESEKFGETKHVTSRFRKLSFYSDQKKQASDSGLGLPINNPKPNMYDGIVPSTKFFHSKHLTAKERAEFDITPTVIQESSSKMHDNPTVITEESSSKESASADNNLPTTITAPQEPKDVPGIVKDQTKVDKAELRGADTLGRFSASETHRVTVPRRRHKHKQHLDDDVSGGESVSLKGDHKSEMENPSRLTDVDTSKRHLGKTSHSKKLIDVNASKKSFGNSPTRPEGYLNLTNATQSDETSGEAKNLTASLRNENALVNSTQRSDGKDKSISELNYQITSSQEKTDTLNTQTPQGLSNNSKQLEIDSKIANDSKQLETKSAPKSLHNEESPDQSQQNKQKQQRKKQRRRKNKALRRRVLTPQKTTSRIITLNATNSNVIIPGSSSSMFTTSHRFSGGGEGLPGTDPGDITRSVLPKINTSLEKKSPIEAVFEIIGSSGGPTKRRDNILDIPVEIVTDPVGALKRSGNINIELIKSGGVQQQNNAMRKVDIPLAVKNLRQPNKLSAAVMSLRQQVTASKQQMMSPRQQMTPSQLQALRQQVRSLRQKPQQQGQIQMLGNLRDFSADDVTTK